jgi:hypothetical protein
MLLYVHTDDYSEKAAEAAAKANYERMMHQMLTQLNTPTK